jgi:hypothetical protein
VGSLISHNPRPPRPVMGIALYIIINATIPQKYNYIKSEIIKLYV